MVRSIITIAAAMTACALVVFFGPALAERAVVFLGDDFGRNVAAVETVYALLIFAPLLIIALIAARWSKVRPLRLGTDRARMIALGVLIGAGGVLAAAALARFAGVLGPGVAPSGGPGLLLWGSAVVLFAAAVEEVYFRGWLQPAIARDLGVPVAVLLSALAFAALHVMGGARSPTTLANLFLGGLLFGILAARGGGLAGPIAAHAVWNWLESMALGLEPNPGIGSFGAIADLDLTGPAIWGGSDEGLNASLGMTIALCAFLIPLLILARGGFRLDAGKTGAAAAE